MTFLGEPLLLRGLLRAEDETQAASGTAVSSPSPPAKPSGHCKKKIFPSASWMQIRFPPDWKNKVDTKPQARSNFDVTSFRLKQISQNFIVGTDHPSKHPTDRVSYRGATSRLKMSGSGSEQNFDSGYYYKLSCLGIFDTMAHGYQVCANTMKHDGMEGCPGGEDMGHWPLREPMLYCILTIQFV
jgi:hypothetical protein